MGIQVTRSGTNWTVDVTALGLVNDTGEKDFLVVINKAEQPLTAYVKTTATVITYSGAALPANTVIDFYRWGLRDVDQLEYGEVTSQLGMNRRLTQIERVLDDLREVKQFIWSGVDGNAAVATHVGQADPHDQYRLKSAAIPELLAHVADADPHPVYATAAELTAALTGYLPTSQKGAVNGLAPLDGTTKVPAINSRGCSAVYTAATGIWTFTWPDNSTQTIDTPLELVFQSVNYNNTTKLVTFTLVGGATTSFSLADLVDLPEVQTNTANPSATPTTGQKLYIRIDTGEMWVANGGVWVGPYLSFTATERTKLSGVQAGATANSTDAALLARTNHTGAQAISTVTNLQSTLDGKQPIDSDLTAIAGLSNADGLIRKTSDGNVALQPISLPGAAVLGGDAAAGRAAIGLESLTQVGTRDITVDRSVDFKNIPARNFYLANSYFGGDLSGGIGVFVDRLSGAHKQQIVNTTGITNPDSIWDVSYDSFGRIDPGQTGTIEVAFQDAKYTAIGGSPVYGSGLIVVTFYEYEPGGTSYPASFKISVLGGVLGGVGATWTTVADKTDFNSNALVQGTHQAFLFKIPNGNAYNYLQKLKFECTSRAGFNCQIVKIEYFANRANLEEAPQFALAAGDRQNIYSEYRFLDRAGNSATIGPGTLKINTGATVSQILTATKTAAGTNPETISVTGAAVGDVAWLSDAVPAKVTAPNTVTFNGAGLSGTIRAVVMRAT